LVSSSERRERLITMSSVASTSASALYIFSSWSSSSVWSSTLACSLRLEISSLRLAKASSDFFQPSSERCVRSSSALASSSCERAAASSSAFFSTTPWWRTAADFASSSARRSSSSIARVSSVAITSPAATSAPCGLHSSTSRPPEYCSGQIESAA
jgi:hypothetical protein